MKNQKIIIAINNYTVDNPFIHYGVQLAKRLDQPALLSGIAKMPQLTIPETSFNSHSSIISPAPNIETIQKEQEAKLQKICMKSREVYNNLEYEVEVGFPEETMIQKAATEKPFMVIVEGNNELHTLGEWFGTYETRLAENINAPVLVVPNTFSWKPVQDILYVMELDDSKAKNIRTLHTIATALNANLHIMLVADEASKGTTEKYNHLVNTMQRFYNYRQLKYSLVTNIDSAKEIQNMSEQLLIDWLAIEHSEEPFFERIFSNLHSDRIILRSEIPVLVF